MFITFEGPEGAGKSTVVSELARRLTASGTKVLCTREPGDGAVGRQIREILLHGGAVTPVAELFLFLADRAQHVETVILPALDAGVTVLCDRYSDSTLVYQGYGRGLDLDFLRQLNQAATGGLEPNLTLLLDLPPQMGLARQTHKDRLDNEPLEFHIKIREGFREEAAANPTRWTMIDASQPLGQVVEECELAIHRRAERYV